MKQTLNSIYEIYFKNMSLVKNQLPKNPQAYNPHAGFKLTQYFATAEEKDFENIFPAMIAEEDFADLQKLVKKMRGSVNKFAIKHKSAKSYCMSFLDFLDKIIETPNKYKKIVKQMQRVYHIDGIESLIDALGGDSVLIRKAIAESYFFDPETVENRHNEIVTCIKNKSKLPARWSYEDGVYNPSVTTKKEAINATGLKYRGYPVKIDKDGNADVRSLINTYTNYSVSSGAKSIFQNYRISHIWGDAYDPKYFTNLWNIVLVPAWANDLLDKANAPLGSITSKMQATYKEICMKFYEMNKLEWAQFNSAPSCRPQDVVKGDFVFNVIKESADKKLGHICKQKLKL